MSAIFQSIHTIFQREESMYNRAVQGQSGKNLDFSTFSQQDGERIRIIAVSYWIPVT